MMFSSQGLEGERTKFNGGSYISHLSCYKIKLLIYNFKNKLEGLGLCLLYLPCIMHTLIFGLNFQEKNYLVLIF